MVTESFLREDPTLLLRAPNYEGNRKTRLKKNWLKCLGALTTTSLAVLLIVTTPTSDSVWVFLRVLSAVFAGLATIILLSNLEARSWYEELSPHPDYQPLMEAVRRYNQKLSTTHLTSNEKYQLEKEFLPGLLQRWVTIHQDRGKLQSIEEIRADIQGPEAKHLLRSAPKPPEDTRALLRVIEGGE